MLEGSLPYDDPASSRHREFASFLAAFCKTLKLIARFVSRSCVRAAGPVAYSTCFIYVESTVVQINQDS